MVIVKLNEFFPWTWILHIVRALLTFNIVHTVLKDKYNTLITFLSLVGSSMLFSYITLQFATQNNEYVIMLLYYSLQFAICLIVCTGKLFPKIFSIIFSLCSYIIGSLVYELLRGLFFGFDLSNALSYEISLVDFILFSLTIFSVHFIFITIIKLIQTKTTESFSYKAKLCLFYFFPITHIFSIYQSFAAFGLSDSMLNSHAKTSAEIMIVIFAIICLIFDFSIIFIVDHIEKVEEKNIQIEKELLKNKLDYQQMMMLKDEKQEFRKIKHDLANIITTAKGFIEIGKPEKAIAILNDTTEDLTGISGFTICSNETINTIIYMKMRQAEKNKILLNTEISENFSVLPDDYDLCRLLGNIIDNALNAVYSLEENRVCKINIEINSKQILIKSQNRFKENTKSKVKSKEHGNGIGIIKETVSRYGGEFVSWQENDIWFTETYLQNKKASNNTTSPNFDLTTRFF